MNVYYVFYGDSPEDMETLNNTKRVVGLEQAMSFARRSNYYEVVSCRTWTSVASRKPQAVSAK